MSLKITEDYAEVIGTPKYLPCISLIMPFEPKMNLKTELDHKLKISIDKIENQLMENYTKEKATPVLIKLKQLIKGLSYDTHKKSIAIFVSPLIEKVYYLDIPVEEKIIIDDSFEIRDLIYSKKEIQKYLLAILSNKWTKIYLADGSLFIRIVSTVPDNIDAYKKDLPEKVANFTDENKIKEILFDKFLKHTDDGLTALLQSKKIPLFVMGTAKTIGHFKTITHNTKHIVDYIPGNFEEQTEAELKKIMEPYVADWKKLIQHNLLKEIDDALSNKKLVMGMKEVWKAASLKKGRLLVVEKNFIYPAGESSRPGIIFSHDEMAKDAFYIKDAVDDTIEKVLASGGDVEFVDEGLLKDYHKIALIEYYG